MSTSKTLSFIITGDASKFNAAFKKAAAEAGLASTAISTHTANAAKKADQHAGLLSQSFAKIKSSLADIGKVTGKGLGWGSLGASAAAVSAPIGAMTLAVGAFGALAMPTIGKVKDALTLTGDAGKEAWKKLDPGQRDLAKSVQGIQRQFNAMATAVQPAITGALTDIAKLASAAMPALKPLADAGASVIHSLVTPLTGLVKSPLFGQFVKQLSSVAVAAGKAFGPIITEALKVLMGLFKEFAPVGLKLISVLGPLLTDVLKQLGPPLAELAKSIGNLLVACMPVIEVLIKLAAAILIKIVIPALNLVAKAITYVVNAVVWFGKHWKEVFDTIVKNLHQWWADVINLFSGAWNWLYGKGKDIISGLWSGLKAIWNGAKGVAGWFASIPGWVTGAFTKATDWLLQKGKDIINGLFTGLKSIWDSVISWFKDIPNKVLHALGIASPPKWSIAAGKFIMQGITKGLKGGWNTVTSFFSSLAGAASGILGMNGPGGALSGTANVPKWISAALALAHAPASWLGALMTLVSKESSGNPRAYNPISVNGEHAEGLFQTLPSTFAAFALPNLSDIWNPIDNAVAGIRYIMSRYGSPYNIPNLFGGPYVGYDRGGLLMPGLTLAYNATGVPERVISPSGAGSGGTVVNNYVTVNVQGHTLADKKELAREISNALEYGQSHGVRVPWPKR